MMAGFKKVDKPTVKKLPVEVDIPEYIAGFGKQKDASNRDKAIGDLTLTGFYYLLRVGEYTMKARTRNTKCSPSVPVESDNAKQTVTFRVCDVTFFKKDHKGRLRQLPRNAPEEDIMTADSATLKLTNQKNGWKGVCINHHANGDSYLCPVRGLGRRVLHIREHTTGETTGKTELCAYYEDGVRFDVTDEDIRQSLKFAAKRLDYPERGIPIERVDTHSLRAGGANALSLAGYSDREIQKMGRWRSDTFKEYICAELSDFSKGMSKDMKKVLNFVNIEGGVFHDVTRHAINSPYDNATGAA